VGKNTEEHRVAGKENTSETLAKGLRVLDVFGGEDVGFSLRQIAESVGLNKTSVYRYVNTYCELGYLRRDERGRSYRLGARALALSVAIQEKNELLRQLKPLADEAGKSHDLHVDVGIISGDAIYLVHRRESRDTRAFRSFSYGSEPYYLATGKAAMAFMEPEELSLLLSRLELTAKTENTITDKEALMAELARTREKGYAVNREEFVPGLIAVGAPLFSLRGGKVVGGISFDSSTEKHSMEEFEERYAPYLVELAKKISAAVSL
jgi:DNA-binding IclR family transcriptional regulator